MRTLLTQQGFLFVIMGNTESKSSPYTILWKNGVLGVIFVCVDMQKLV
ncbi:hypothetical protein PPE_05020 [Paenibacillus polymyxa E681]|nr:hypothetical protein PPE_05020 [Paenibacillus polymyxa E681]